MRRNLWVLALLGWNIDALLPPLYTPAKHIGRRAFVLTPSIPLIAPILFAPSSASAETSVKPTQAELDRLLLGYDNVVYLLDNWDKETTTCRENGGECKRDAEPVRRALGLRSTTDPLFQIEKVLEKVKNMDGVDMDELDGYFEAKEDFESAIAMSNSMAFISQFGEYNPGGGKDEVFKYLEESKKQVKIVKNCLETILKVVKLA